MVISTNGIVVNEYGEVLLIRRNDSKTMAPPGGSLETGELPDANVAREVREETGLIVMPVRLVGVYFARWRARESLNFVFRCLQRGGELTPSFESPEVAFFKATPLPQPMAGFHRQRVMAALTHEGGPPVMAEERHGLGSFLVALKLVLWVYPRLQKQRLREGVPPYQRPPDFGVTAHVMARDRDDRVLWVRRPGSAEWRLPGADCNQRKAPWLVGADAVLQATGLKPDLTALSGFFLDAAANHIDLLFEAEVDVSQRGDAGPDISWSPAGAEGATTAPEQITWVANALAARGPIFQRKDTAMVAEA